MVYMQPVLLQAGAVTDGRLIFPWLEWPQTRTLTDAFGDVPLRFVGGAVRDALLARPVSDVDAATPMPPEDVLALLKKSKIKAIPTGISHGTITAVVDEKTFEITTLRRDVATDGRHAVVAYTDSWEEDAARRDFTMNALYCDAEGNVSDYTGGVDDAKAGRVRFIGDACRRIEEDALRILRFFRFYAHYGRVSLDVDGLAACERQAALIEGLSGERIRQEMLKLLVADKAAEVIGLMRGARVLAHVLPEGVEETGLQRLPQLFSKAAMARDSIVALALLLRSLGDDAVNTVTAITDRWKLSRAQQAQLTALCKERLSLDVISDVKSSKSHVRSWGKERFMQHALLTFAEQNVAAENLHAVSWIKGWQIPVFPVSGDDLKALGISQGKRMGELLAKLEAEWEEKDYTPTKQALLEKVK